VASFAVSLDLRSLGDACTTFTASKMALPSVFGMPVRPVRFVPLACALVGADHRFWERGDAAELLRLTWFLRAHAEVGGRQVFKRRRA
jgi:hypothetical protein